MKKIRIGIVGLGRVASKTHIPVLKSLDNVQVVAGADKDPDRAERVKNVFGLGRVYSDYENMYHSERLDAVYVCLPNFLHKDACTKALKNGLNVLCEKPMCMSLKDAEEVAFLAENKGLVLMPGYKKRYATNFLKAKKIIEEGLLGDIIQVQGTFLTPGPYISWDPKSDWYLDERWRGVIYDIGSHIVDLMLYLVPYEVGELNSIVHHGFTGYNTPTNCSCVFNMGKGTLGDITIGWRASTDVISVGIHGTAGSINVSRDYFAYVNPSTDPVDTIMLYLDNIFGEVKSIFMKVADKIRGKDFYREDVMQAVTFCKAICGKEAPPINGKDAVRVHKFLEKMASVKSNS